MAATSLEPVGVPPNNWGFGWRVRWRGPVLFFLFFAEGLVGVAFPFFFRFCRPPPEWIDAVF